MATRLEHGLANLVAGQRRCGDAKQFVFLDGPIVMKGPYPKHSSKLENIRFRYEKFVEWQTPHILGPLPHPDDSSVPWIEEDIDGTMWLIMRNVAEDYPIESNMWYDKAMKRKHKVLVRSGVDKLLYILNDETKDHTWIEASMKTLLCGLADCDMLEVGDMGLSNILADEEKQKLYIIDWEEKRKEDVNDDWFFFRHKPNNVVWKWWMKIAPPLYSHVAEYISSRPDSARKDRLLTLLKKYGTPQCDPIVCNQIGSMHWAGRFNRASVTYSGFTIDVMISAVQKYIRRGIVDKALLVTWELFRMAEVDAKSVQSNMLNRLAIIACEDIGPAHMGVLFSILKCSREKWIEGNRNIYEILALVKWACQCPKTRIMSHLNATWIRVPGLQLLEQRIAVDSETVDVSRDSWGRYLHHFYVGDDRELRYPACMFAYRLSQRSKQCLVWLGRYQRIADNKKLVKAKSRYSKSDPMIVIWMMMKEYLQVELWELLMNAYFTRAERRPFMMTALCVILYHRHLFGMYAPDTIHEIIQTKTNEMMKEAIVEQMRSGNYVLTIDKYVIDKHTYEGSKSGANTLQFVQEGAFVANEDMSFDDPIARDIYVKLAVDQN